MLALPLAGDSLLALTRIAGAGGLLMPLCIGAHDGLISRSSKGHERRALFTADSAIYSGAYSLGMLVGGGIIGAFGATPTMVVCGIAMVLVPILLLVTRRPSGVREQ